MNRTTIPFSRSSWRSFCPNQTLQSEFVNFWVRETHSWYQVIVIPLGIQVSLMESRLFLLLKAVFIPITIKAFFLGELSWEDLIASGKLSRLPVLWEVRVADSSIWSVEIVLSNDLQIKQRIHQRNHIDEQFKEKKQPPYGNFRCSMEIQWIHHTFYIGFQVNSIGYNDSSEAESQIKTWISNQFKSITEMSLSYTLKCFENLK